MSQPLGYLITWTTYGSWLPGDQRGWVQKDCPEIQATDPCRRQAAFQALKEAPVVLDSEERKLVADTIRDHCAFRGWELLAVNGLVFAAAQSTGGIG